MKFAKYLHKDLIFMNFPCVSKKEAIEYITKSMCEHYKLPYEKDILMDVAKREKIKSTGFGHGVAIPHGRLELADKLYVSFAHSTKGINWDSVDGKPVFFIFFIVGPSKPEKEYLEALSDISRIMIRCDVREGIINAKRPEDVIGIIQESGARGDRRGKNKGQEDCIV